MSLTAPVRYSNRPGVSLHAQNSYKVKPGVTIYAGALVGVDPNSGYLQNWSSASAANVRFRGIAMPVAATNVSGQTTPGAVIGSASLSPTPECPVNEGGVILEGVTVAGAKVPVFGSNSGQQSYPVYATDENTFTMTATLNVGAIGELVRCDVAGIGDVRLFTPQEYLALEAIGKV
jgi:hypothetical protein